MVLDLVIIGLAITLEPITIVAFILILGAERAPGKGLALILGWLVSLVSGEFAQADHCGLTGSDESAGWTGLVPIWSPPAL